MANRKLLSTITRRDFINGILMLAGASMLPFGCINDAVLATLDPLYYPPALTGLRGNHPGSNTHAHSRALAKKSDWGPTTKLKEEYDLIVVGGGISGLATAYFFQQKHGKDKKMLIKKAYDALPQGGALVVIENIIDDNRSENTFGLLMSLNMLIETPEGFDFSAADFDGWAKEIGFAQTSVIHLTGPSSAVIAIK